jgi:glycerophosphoryl diester phosphodiesterase
LPDSTPTADDLEAAPAVPGAPLRRIGHKGADAIVPGNTEASFAAAVELGVEMIELDVLWLRDGHPKAPAVERSPLVIAHDWGDAARREPLSLAEGLDLFTRPPLDGVEIDCDLKLRGREDELASALRERHLIGRAMVSTMELSSLRKLRRLEPELRLGWTYPKVTRDWNRKLWAKPLVLAAMVGMRRRLPGHATEMLPELGVRAMWVFHPLITRRLAAVTREAGVELIAWTVDDVERMRTLRQAGVDGICSNDPRLFGRL